MGFAHSLKTFMLVLVSVMMVGSAVVHAVVWGCHNDGTQAGMTAY